MHRAHYWEELTKYVGRHVVQLYCDIVAFTEQAIQLVILSEQA